jgi:ADP-ribose pyrophosphatase YjhB (NUDIX family)
MNKTLTAQQLACWVDTIRHISAEGLHYADNEYDLERYKTLQKLAMEMTGFITDQLIEVIEPFRESFFARWSPMVGGAAAVIDNHGAILLMRRSDNGLWGMPAGGMNVGETVAEAVVRETFEETGIRTETVALVGVYDSRMGGASAGFHTYKFTFLCKPTPSTETRAPSPLETLETAWFEENALPAEIFSDHLRRIRDAYRVWRGDYRAHFDA